MTDEERKQIVSWAIGLLVGVVIGAAIVSMMHIPQNPADAKKLYEQRLAEEKSRHEQAMGEKIVE